MFARSTRTLFLPILALSISLGVLSPAEAMIYISGRVVNGANGAPVDGVVVSLFPEGAAAASLTLSSSAATQSLKNGAYVLAAPAPGKYRVVAAQPNFLPLEPLITVPRTGLAGVNLTLSPIPTLRVQLQGPDGNPARTGTASGWVWLLWDRRAGVVMGLNHRGRWNADRDFRAVRIRRDGILRIPSLLGLPLQDITAGIIEVSVPGVGVGSLKINRWAEGELTLRLGPGASLNGNVVDGTGKPIVGAEVSALRIAPETFKMNGQIGNLRQWRSLQNGMGSPVPGALTDQQGHYTLTGLFHDQYLIAMSRPNGSTQGKLVQISAQNTELTTRWGEEEAPAMPVGGGNAVFEGQVPLMDIIERLDPAGSTGSKGTVTLSGRVINSVTGAAEPRARVSLYGSSPFGEFQMRGSAPPFQPFDETMSGPDGGFTLRGLAGRQYGVRVEKYGYQVLQTDVMVAARTPPPLALRIHPVTSITLNPTGPGGKKATGLQGYIVVNWGSAVVEGEPVPANPDGNLVIQPPGWDIPLGETSHDEPVSVTLAARSPTAGYAIRHFQGWPPSPLPMTLGPAASLSGLVVDEKGHPLPNVPLLITRTAHTPDQLALPELPIIASTQSDPTGHFAVDALPRGNYSIIETYRGRQFRALIVHLIGDHVDVTVRPTEQ